METGGWKLFLLHSLQGHLEKFAPGFAVHRKLAGFKPLSGVVEPDRVFDLDVALRIAESPDQRFVAGRYVGINEVSVSAKSPKLEFVGF